MVEGQHPKASVSKHAIFEGLAHSCSDCCDIIQPPGIDEDNVERGFGRLSVPQAGQEAATLLALRRDD